MRRMASGWSPCCAALAVGAIAARAREARRDGTRRRRRDEADDLGRLERPRAERVQEGRGRVRREAHPDVTVNVVGGINDDKIIAALRAGNAPDVVQLVHVRTTSASTARRGGWVDLGPYLKKDKIDDEHLPGGDALLHAVQGQALRAAAARRRLRPLLQQEAASKAAGLNGPPKTLAELTTYAKKLTKRNPTARSRSSASTRSFGFYQNIAGAYQPLVRRRSGSTPTGKSSSRQDPALGEARCSWQKSLVDCYGYENLVKWQAGAGDEFSASHAFETRQARDDASTASGASPSSRPSTRSSTTARRRCRSTTPTRASTARATSTARSSASRRTARTGTRPGSSSST